MTETHQNYFTCTLGQALKLKLRQQPFQNVIALIDVQAKELPDSPALGFADFVKNDMKHPNPLTFKQLRDLSLNASSILSSHVGRASNNGRESGLENIALLCTSSLDFVLTWLGLMRLGWSVLLLAPQLEPPAIQHLCSTLNVKTIVVDENYSSKASTLKDQFNIVNVPTTWEPRGQASPMDNVQIPNIACIFHTSGTSSGLPKPIPQSQMGAVGALPRFLDTGKPATFTCTPLYHGGLADSYRAWTSGAIIWFFPEGVVPITASHLVKAVDFARGKSNVSVSYFSSVPFVLQMLSEESEGVDLLKSMDLVGVGGAALPSSIGDKLVKEDVALLSRFGSAECGFIASSHRDYANDKDWQYLRLVDDAELLTLEPRDEGLSELIVKPGWPFRAKSNRDDGSFATSDLFEPHPSKSNAWRYHSRADSQITLANGKKFDPAPVEEGMMASTQCLQDVLVFGTGKYYPGALLFPRPKGMSDEDIIDAVWPHVEKSNQFTQGHARISKQMLIVVPATNDKKPLEKSSKGTILRRKAEERYAENINGAYEGKQKLPLLNKTVSDKELSSVVRDCFSKVLGRDIDSDQDIYQQGVDSIACVQVRKLLESTCLPGDDRSLPLNVIYDQGSITSLVSYLRRIREGADVSDKHDIAAQHQLMQNLTDKYSTVKFPESSSSNARGKVVVLTGATGFLGAHILDLLRQDKGVDRIYCLIRASDEHAAHERLSKALAKRGLPDLESISGTDSKVVILPSKLFDDDLGLSSEQRERIAEQATLFVHAAWTVNFSLRLKSFEDQLAGTRNLLKLASDGGVRFCFISSTAAVSSATSTSITEALSPNAADASPLGYSQSKWVAEHICASANEFTTGRDLPVSIIRVGQLCGNAKGIWNSSEAYPLMLSTASVSGSLPDLPDEQLNWMPVELAAEAILQIAFTNESARDTTPVYHVLNPHTTPSWKNLLHWIKDSGKGPNFKVLPPSDWVARLEERLADKAVNHPSQGLLAMWKDRFSARSKEAEGADPSNAACPVFEVALSRKASQTMQDLEPLGQERVDKMWEWACESIAMAGGRLRATSTFIHTWVVNVWSNRLSFQTSILELKPCDLAKPTCSRCARLRIPCTGANSKRYKFLVANLPAPAETTAKIASPIRFAADPFAQVPASPETRNASFFISRLAVHDVRYDVSAYGGFFKFFATTRGSQ
ncbi:hypothetical protein S7711_02299 [Stachybotrys chartarum IBT 7711]|uniref:Carrier domain-containing protein n=1 Tax=Stachybotrys chartarum (strain CBS 109288 / IBT 7711) TaxID=1280523 RepID=A0A084B0V9_STACB|nr:hypothetical protein S7711_02299 [Stachybotrys chartarum IBT 7711]